MSDENKLEEFENAQDLTNFVKEITKQFKIGCWRCNNARENKGTQDMSEEKGFGLDSSSVKVEQFPMVLHAPEKFEMTRIH